MRLSIGLRVVFVVGLVAGADARAEAAPLANYAIHGRDDLPAAVREAALRMGFVEVGARTEPEQITLEWQHGLLGQRLSLRVDDPGHVSLLRNEDLGGLPYLAPTRLSGFLIQAARQVADPAAVPPHALALDSRSSGVTALLDLTLPELGALYVFDSDPLANRHAAWISFAARALIDLLCLGLVLLSALDKRPAAAVRGGLDVGGLVGLLINRAFNAQTDLERVELRNRLAGSGFAFER